MPVLRRPKNLRGNNKLNQLQSLSFNLINVNPTKMPQLPFAAKPNEPSKVVAVGKAVPPLPSPPLLPLPYAN